MKIMVGLLVGLAMLIPGVANAQYLSQASVSGRVLSYGPRGFMLQGPDGNYGIVVTPSTVTTDPWNTRFATGPGNVEPGDYVTAIGIPTSQWIMIANRVIVRNAIPAYPSYGGYYYGYPGNGIVTGSGWYPAAIQPGNYGMLPGYNPQVNGIYYYNGSSPTSVIVP
ncbi:MAG TPA: hypothetical protein VHE55_01290 [Fimbriimonadaceae bacterium]|nr:hypothetical protein [Fimbriimonadaceae bacterium]